MADLGRQIAEIRVNIENRSEGSRPKTGEPKTYEVKVGECWAVRINSGKFGVEWDRTKPVLENGAVDMRVIQVAEPDVKEWGESEQGFGMKKVDNNVLLHKSKCKIEAAKRKSQDEGNRYKTHEGGLSTWKKLKYTEAEL